MPHKLARARRFPSVEQVYSGLTELRALLTQKADAPTVDIVVHTIGKKVFAYRPENGQTRLTEQQRRDAIAKLHKNIRGSITILDGGSLDFELLPFASPREMRRLFGEALKAVSEAEKALAHRPALQRNYFLLRLADHILHVLRLHKLERNFTKVYDITAPLIGYRNTEAANTLRSVKRMRARESKAGSTQAVTLRRKMHDPKSYG